MLVYKVEVYENGTRFWFLDGKLHREDGPAVEHSNGSKEWFLNGESFSEKKFNELMEKARKERSSI